MTGEPIEEIEGIALQKFIEESEEIQKWITSYAADIFGIKTFAA